MSPSTASLLTDHKRQILIAVLALALMVLAVALALRAMQQGAALHERNRDALTIATYALELQHAAGRLRGLQADPAAGPPTAWVEAAPRRGALLARMQQVQASLLALDLTPQERRLASVALDPLAALQAPATRGEIADQLDRLDRALLDLVEAARARTEQAAITARQQSNVAGLALVAAAALTVLLGISMAFVVKRTIDANVRRMGQLDQMAHEDGLTGVMNRRGLDEQLPIELARAQRQHSALTVAMLDFDHFKRFNDRRGHGAGDALLRGTAQAWRKQLRPTDILARYGGEEFTLVLPVCDADQASALIERLRPLMPDRQTFSAGIATWNGSDNAEELVRTADIALLQAKKGGRNRSVIAGREPQAMLPLRLA